MLISSLLSFFKETSQLFPAFSFLKPNPLRLLEKQNKTKQKRWRKSGALLFNSHLIAHRAVSRVAGVIVCVDALAPDDVKVRGRIPGGRDCVAADINAT